MSDIFLTGDTHFGHPLMLTALNRPYENVLEMNAKMIDEWNWIVGPNDTVWHLGDFAMKSSARDVADIFHALNGRKHLIIGNHDVDKGGNLLPEIERLPWVSVSHAGEIKHDRQRILLSHYAGWAWNGQHKGTFQACGHSHGTLATMPGSIDVGVDAQGLKPISVDEFVIQAEDSILEAEARIEAVFETMVSRLPQFEERGEEIRRARNQGAFKP
ncbi:metallophosphoesterase [Paraburkholderia aspalathi]|nr:metallophosphoesterase [Paraburkholderia aspalathi]